jgi:hypothetical protein
MAASSAGGDFIELGKIECRVRKFWLPIGSDAWRNATQPPIVFQDIENP